MIRYVATNLTDLHREPSFLSELLTQVTNGVPLEVLKEQDEKWCRVRQSDGYEGWAYAPFLTSSALPPATHMVKFPHAALVSEPDLPPDYSNNTLLTHVLAGTKVHVAEQRGREWCRVELAGAIPGGWLKASR